LQRKLETRRNALEKMMIASAQPSCSYEHLTMLSVEMPIRREKQCSAASSAPPAAQRTTSHAHFLELARTREEQTSEAGPSRSTFAQLRRPHVHFLEAVVFSVASIPRLDFVEIVGDPREPHGSNPNYFQIAMLRHRKIEDLLERPDPRAALAVKLLFAGWKRICETSRGRDGASSDEDEKAPYPSLRAWVVGGHRDAHKHAVRAKRLALGVVHHEQGRAFRRLQARQLAREDLDLVLGSCVAVAGG